MADSREQVVRLLRDARSLELRRIAALRDAAADAPHAYRERLEAHLDEERRHADRVQARLDQLDGGPGLVEAGLGAVTALVAVGARIARRPLDLVEHLAAGEATFGGPRGQASAEAFELAGYVALERVALDTGDTKTAELARDIAGEERRMLEALEDVLRELADDLAGGPPETGPAPEEAAPAQEPAPETPEPAAGAATPTGAEATVPDAQPPEADLIGVEEDPSPAVMRETARAAAEEDAELVAEFSEPGAEEGAGPELHVDPPWEGYDRMTASEIEERLRDADAVVAAAVQLYERNGKGRKSVLAAAERAVSERSAPSRQP